MNIVLYIIPAAILVLILMKSVKIYNENERGVVVKLGKVSDVVGPGLVFMAPFVNQCETVNLDEKLPDWKSLTKEEITDRLKEATIAGL